MMTSNPSEYIPSNAVLTVAAYGLNPSSTYNLDDSLVASGGVYSSGSSNLETSISVGTASTSGIYPASNGTLIFSYSPSYTTKTTGSSATLTMTGSVSAYDGYSYGYKTIGTPSVSSPSSFGILSQGATGTNLVISGLIPFESPVYPGTSYYYSAFLGSASISVTYSSLTSTRIYASGGSFSGTFTVPYQPGLLDINVTYYGSSYSSNLTTQYVVISTESTSYSSGTLQVIPLSTAGTYEVVGNGYYNKNPRLYYTTYSGPQLEGTETLTNGAFAVQISPGTSTPAGTYSVFTELSNGGLTYFVYSSYTVTSNLTLVTASSGSTQIYSGPIGTALYVKASGLVPQSYYKVYFGGDLEITDTGTNLAAGTDTFDVPTSVPGTHTVTVVPVSSTTPVESAVFRVTSNPDLTLVTDSNYAFPGQVILFTAADFTAPTLPTGATAAGLATTYATIELNSSDYQTVQATYSSSGKGFINGSFIMPNDNPGTYFELTITAFEVQPISYSIGTSPASTGYATVTLAYTGSQSDYLGLVSGNGALVTGISQSQIASLETDINTTLSVPVSQLDASVTSIQNSVAQITTSFGTMQASLNAINATVTSINAGVATLHTTLGQVTTSLSSLNSTVVALNGDTAKISTAVGIFSTTLNNINATVTLSNGNIATIKTDLGTFTGNVTSVSNGIATIQTSLGTITANTRSTAFPTGMFFILEIVILVLAVIAVAFSAVAMMNTRKKY
jgi:prefoldin subunit 5